MVSVVPTYRSKTLLLALALGFTTLAFIVAKTGRDALFFQGSGGLLQLPLIYINIGAASLPLAIVFVKTMKVWGARVARSSCRLCDGVGARLARGRYLVPPSRSG